MACDANPVGEVDVSLPFWITLVSGCVNSVLFSQTSFHVNQPKGEQKAKASWAACIVHGFPRCLLCRLSGWELFLFRPSAWFSFGWLWFLYLLNTWGQDAFSEQFESHPFFLLFTQFGPALNLWTASNVHCNLTKLGLEGPAFSKADLTLPLVIQWAFQQGWL